MAMKNLPSPDMPADAVLEIIQFFNRHDIEAIIDGGWAVDALLGEQTRPHEDLDLAVFHKDVPLIRCLLEERGYRIIPRNDSWECNFVYGNDQGHLVDIHSCSFDENHNHIYGVPYDWDSLQGSGEIIGVNVRCIPPARLVEFHTGYKLDENDFHDVRLLCDRYQLPIPEDYQLFLKNNI
jgi:lincosamide nucleotidyltransferase A/C/D/E